MAELGALFRAKLVEIARLVKTVENAQRTLKAWGDGRPAHAIFVLDLAHDASRRARS